MDKIILGGETILLARSNREENTAKRKNSAVLHQSTFTGRSADKNKKVRYLTGPTSLSKGVKRTLCSLQVERDIDPTDATKKRLNTINVTLVGEDHPEAHVSLLEDARDYLSALIADKQAELAYRVELDAAEARPADAALIQGVITAADA